MSNYNEHARALKSESADCPARPDRDEVELQLEISALAGLDLKEYFNYYPGYFRDELEALYAARKSEDDGPFFRLNLDVPSPLAWLLLNEPRRFLLACEKCILDCRRKFKEYSSGAWEALSPEDQRETIRLREEIESYLLDFDLHNYQNILQQEIARRYLERACLTIQEQQDDYQAENIDPFVKNYLWMFDPHAVAAIEKRTQELFAALTRLFELMDAQGRLEGFSFEEEHAKF
jgi:hypothetical protein